MRVLPLLALLLVGCPKTATLQAPSPANVRVATVLDSATSGEIDTDHTMTLDAVVDEVRKRNLTPLTAEVSGPHTRRLQLLAEGATGGLVLLVESTARYSSQMNGRYRWTIEVRARLADPAHLEEALETEFSVPVHLIYAYEQEEEALEAATASIARRVGVLLDEWIRGQTG